ncbi:MAG: hypothetical protein V7719_16920 [Psychroserpens sp.]|uniref:hypothetical protein n=1 Tax=Psychroserpens sp. TaxID=2020870 RepID=UPI0030036D19
MKIITVSGLAIAINKENITNIRPNGNKGTVIYFTDGTTLNTGYVVETLVDILNK